MLLVDPIGSLGWGVQLAYYLTLNNLESQIQGHSNSRVIALDDSGFYGL